MKLWSKLDAAAGYLIGGVACLLGIYALFFFIARPMLLGRLPVADEVVLAIGIFSIGASLLAYARIKTKSLMWFAFANIAFWFWVYGIVFGAEQLAQGSSPSIQSLLHSVGALVITILFVRLMYKNLNRERETRGSHEG